MLCRTETIRLECAEQVATLWLDADRLTPLMLGDIREAVEVLRKKSWADVLLVRSSCRGGFPNRPTIQDYESLIDAHSRREFSRWGQETFQELADLSPAMPTVALIDGECLDAGVELILACDYRLAVARPDTRFGLTFLESGLLPCWGLTQRLPRRVGPQVACEWIEQSCLLDARSAVRFGLVDHVCAPRLAKSQIWWTIAEIQDRTSRPHRDSVFRRLRHRSWFVDRRVFQPRLRQSSTTPIGRIVDAMRVGWRYGEAMGLLAERAAFANAGWHRENADRRQLADRFEKTRAAWPEGTPSRCVGITHANNLGQALVLWALAQNQKVILPPGADRWIDDLLRRGIETRQLNILEANERRRNILRWTDAIPRCDLMFFTDGSAEARRQVVEVESRLPPDTVLVLTSLKLDADVGMGDFLQPQRVMACDLSHMSPFGPTVRIVTTERTAESSAARLFHWLTRSGLRPVIEGALRETVKAEQCLWSPAA